MLPTHIASANVLPTGLRWRSMLPTHIALPTVLPTGFRPPRWPRVAPAAALPRGYSVPPPPLVGAAWAFPLPFVPPIPRGLYKVGPLRCAQRRLYETRGWGGARSLAVTPAITLPFLIAAVRRPRASPGAVIHLPTPPGGLWRPGPVAPRCGGGSNARGRASAAPDAGSALRAASGPLPP